MNTQIQKMRKLLAIISFTLLSPQILSVEINLNYLRGLGGDIPAPGQFEAVDTCVNPVDQPVACNEIRLYRDYFEHVRIQYTSPSDSNFNSVTIGVDIDPNREGNGGAAGVNEPLRAIFGRDSVFGSQQTLSTALHEFMHIFGFTTSFFQLFDANRNQAIWTGQNGTACAQALGFNELTLDDDFVHLNSNVHSTELMSAAADGVTDLGLAACMFSDMFNEPVVDMGAEIMEVPQSTTDTNLRIDVINFTHNTFQNNANSITVEVTVESSNNVSLLAPECSQLSPTSITCDINSIANDTSEILNIGLANDGNDLNAGTYTVLVRTWHNEPHIDPAPLNNIVQRTFSIAEPVVVAPTPTPTPTPAPTPSSSGGGGALNILFILLLFFQTSFRFVFQSRQVGQKGNLRR